MSDVWTSLIYFIFGLAGTLCRIALSPSLPFGLNRRTVVEGIAGGVSGLLLPYFGTLFAGVVNLDPVRIAATPVIVKAGLIWLVNYSGSFSVGELIARRNNVGGGS